MRKYMRWILSAMSLSGVLLIGVAVYARRVDTPAPELIRDWNTQCARLLAPNQEGPVSTSQDAAGACDGIKDGRYGFHTGLDDHPWWHVDLGSVMPIHQVVIYNRCDAADRTRNLHILLSNDGITWRTVYRHDGSIFYGATDGKPLIIKLADLPGRFVRVQLPDSGYMHLDEVEVYSSENPEVNRAIGCKADECSVSQWSTIKSKIQTGQWPVEEAVRRGIKLGKYLQAHGVNSAGDLAELVQIDRAVISASSDARRDLYYRTSEIVRKIALSNPLVNFDSVLFVKRAPGTFSHMSDQNYSWWSRAGGGIYALQGIHSSKPTVRYLTASFPAGSFLSPDLSYDGKKVVFAYCRYHPELSNTANKVDKDKLPEDGFYHIYEMNIDGSAVKQLTRGRYDDFDGRYLPNGKLAFLSTRRGQEIQCGVQSARATLTSTQPDSYVRCGGDAWRPVAVYTLHTIDRSGENMLCISPFESFEWTPSVAADGRILYARWDYVDRNNMPFMKLWSVNPDGTNPRIVWGNYTVNPYSVFEARSIPGSSRLMFTASAHHSITGGPLCLLDPNRSADGIEAITRWTPEVCYPETDGWPSNYYNDPWPLSEQFTLCSWSNKPLVGQGGTNPPDAMGIYLADSFGNLQLLYRDPTISSMYPIPIRARSIPPVVGNSLAKASTQEGSLFLQDIYAGLTGVTRGAVKRLRIVGMPPKTQPWMNTPNIGVTEDDPGKYILGTVPVEKDGSAHFKVPSGVSFFFQALDKDGFALQTMRSLTSVQPGQTLSCIGCHEGRTTSPPLRSRAVALNRKPSRITLGPDGSWPLRFDRLVQPILDTRCVSCHIGGKTPDLRSAKSWQELMNYGKPSLRETIRNAYARGTSTPGESLMRQSAVMKLMNTGHHGIKLNSVELERIATWMDTYGQKQGAFSSEQETRLIQMKSLWANLLTR